MQILARGQGALAGFNFLSLPIRTLAFDEHGNPVMAGNALGWRYPGMTAMVMALAGDADGVLFAWARRLPGSMMALEAMFLSHSGTPQRPCD